MDAEMSFIQATEAAQFLQWAGNDNVEGPINATANGVISLKDLISLIEEKSGERAKIALLGTEEIRSPYAIPATWYMRNDKAEQLGFPFSQLEDWLPPLIEQIAGTTAKQ